MIVKDKDGWVKEVTGHCTCCTKTQELTEEIPQKDLEDNWDHCFLTPDMMKKTLRPNVVYTFNGQPKFLLLRKCIRKKAYGRALEALTGPKGERLEFNKAKNSDRDAVKQLYGGERLLGFFAKYAPNDRLTQATRDQWPVFCKFGPLLKEMNDQLEWHLPDYYKFHHKMALALDRPGAPGDEYSVDNGLLNGDFKYPHKAKHKGAILNMFSWSLQYLIGITDFSTVQANKSIVFTAHTDGNNVADTLGCITTLGEHAGGPLVWPRFGVGAKVGVRDMLICDSNSEYHGNLGPIVGTRFSIVAFLHNSLHTRGTRKKK